MNEKLHKKREKEVLPHLILTATGPGEVNGLVRPVMKEIQQLSMPWNLSVVLWKSGFSVGSEEEVLAQIPGAHWVYRVKGNLRALCSSALMSSIRDIGPPRALLHLGGEPILSLLLARRLQCPAIIYSETRRIRSYRGFQKVFLAERPFNPDDPLVHERRANGRFQVVGNLVVDALNGLFPKPIDPHAEKGSKEITIGLFPGSRPYQVKYLAPFFLSIAKRVKNEIKHARFLFAKSEYLSESDFIRLTERNRSRISPTEASCVGIPILSSKEVLAKSDMVVMLPGTCTAEAMFLSVPMIVLAPYYRLGSNPAPIVPGYMDTILGMTGKCVKRKILLSVLNRFSFLSHPNLKAGREVVPELRGWIRPHQVVSAVIRMAQEDQWRKAITNELKRLAGPPGAAKAVVDALRPFMIRHNY